MRQLMFYYGENWLQSIILEDPSGVKVLPSGKLYFTLRNSTDSELFSAVLTLTQDSQNTKKYFANFAPNPDDTKKIPVGSYSYGITYFDSLKKIVLVGSEIFEVLEAEARP